MHMKTTVPESFFNKVVGLSPETLLQRDSNPADTATLWQRCGKFLGDVVTTVLSKIRTVEVPVFDVRCYQDVSSTLQQRHYRWVSRHFLITDNFEFFPVIKT